MGLLNEIIGAVVAVEGAEKLDPNASLLTKGIAAVAGFEGVKTVTEHMDKQEAEEAVQPNQATRVRCWRRTASAVLVASGFG